MILSVCVICLAGFAQGLTGFGFGLVAISLLPMVMSLKEAAALTALLNLVVCGLTFYSIRHHFCWRRALALVAGTCVGVPAGVYMLVQLNELLLLRALGAVMLLISANELLRARSRPAALSPRLGFPFGLVSGGLSGAFSIGGPPAIAFTYAQPWTKEQIVAVLQVVFGISTLERLLLMGNAGLVGDASFRIGFWSILPLILAIALGRRFFARLPQPILKQTTFSFLAAMGTKYLLFP